MAKFIALVISIVGLLFISFIGALIAALRVMLIWNVLVVPNVTNTLFGTNFLGFWQALCLCFLCGALFKARSK